MSKKNRNKNARAPQRKHEQHPTTPADPHATHHGANRRASMVEMLPPQARAELDGLREHEKKIMAGLKDPATARLFFTNPHAALAKMKVPVPPTLKAGLKGFEVPKDVLEPKGFRLPNGQLLVPKVTIRFVTEGGDAGDR